MNSFNTIKNKTVILRCDFNEPIIDNCLMSTDRIDANIITTHELLAKNNRVILISHHSDKKQTLLPVYNYLKSVFDNNSLRYLDTTDTDTIVEYFKIHTKNTNDKVILLENTRLFGEDLDENNDSYLAGFLAALGEVYVYDAFSVGHRSHASTTGIADFLPSYFGPVFTKEYSSLKKITDELNVSLIFMGGAKLSTKLPLLKRFLDNGAYVCVGGAMLHPILKLKNINIKNSFIEDSFDFTAIGNSLLSSPGLILPQTLIWNKQGDIIIDNIFDFEEIEKIRSNKNIQNILWNGPVGLFEQDESRGSDMIFEYITHNKNCFTVTGGGDTLTYLESKSSRTFDDFSYVSLSGGAMLEFLAKGTLPILSKIKT